MNESEKLGDIKWRHERDDTFYEDIEWLIEQVEKIKLYKEVLEFYADYNNYSKNTAMNGYDVLLDNGELARKILS